jgi:serine/threonine protein kinase
MRFIHAHKIIHCNLMPHNILLNSDWDVRIYDFSYSVSCDETNLHSSGNFNLNNDYAAVSLRYLVLESSSDNACPESDVFLFGIILYELLFWHPRLINTDL